MLEKGLAESEEELREFTARWSAWASAWENPW